jgi:hypothetical protein
MAPTAGPAICATLGRLRGVPLSSAFLYVGIVAIWAFVLVPRWLRRPQAPPVPAAEYEASPAEDGGYDEQGAADPAPADAAFAAAPGGTASAAGAAAVSSSGLRQESAATRPLPPLPRSRMLQSRRRLLTLLFLLCAAAGACAALKLTPWWACIPPAGMLGMYLLLLRETALADAEQARQRATLEMRVQAARQREQAYWDTQTEEHSAEIIDISARVGDQLYDQYADATIRAVGD